MKTTLCWLSPFDCRRKLQCCTGSLLEFRPKQWLDCGCCLRWCAYRSGVGLHVRGCKVKTAMRRAKLRSREISECVYLWDARTASLWLRAPVQVVRKYAPPPLEIGNCNGAGMGKDSLRWCGRWCAAKTWLRNLLGNCLIRRGRQCPVQRGRIRER